jgi:hypothetical protein
MLEFPENAGPQVIVQSGENSSMGKPIVKRGTPNFGNTILIHHQPSSTIIDHHQPLEYYPLLIHY